MPRLVSKRRPLEHGGGLPSASKSSEIDNAKDAVLPAMDREQKSPTPDSDDIDSPRVDSALPETSARAQKRKRLSTTPKSEKKQKASRSAAAEFVPTVPWPSHFSELEKTFKALNTVYTFCSTRKHLATTFENLRTSVEGLLKRPLLVDDIAQMKSLVPNLIKFAYVDPDAAVHPSGSSSRDKEDCYRSTSSDQPGDHREQQVLLFEFNDGELKASNGGGKVVSKRFRKKKDEDAPNTTIAPTFKTSALTKMIDRRNSKFHEAVDELLVASAAQSQDPVHLLLTATAEHLPVQAESAGDQAGKSDRRADLDFFLRNPANRPSIESLISEVVDDDDYRGQIVDGGRRIIEARNASFGVLDVPLSQPLSDALYETKKITQLFSHQAEAVNHLAGGHSVIVSTSTSSGKSLIYQIPVLSALEADPSSTALYIFPTKALAQDQKRALAELLRAHIQLDWVKIATFDGDTPQQDRDYIRENANVIFTNPDMLHMAILPREESWRRFFRNLKLIVVDELHMYNGLFGCHVAFIMRRLKRVCTAVGNRRVQSVSCSATIANPDCHMRAIFGIEDVKVVDVDGSPAGRKEYLVWNPPLIDERAVTQGRISTITEASRLLRFLMERGVRTIAFCKVRKVCELLMKQVQTDLALEGRSDMGKKVMSYRSGYNAEDRRRIEREMFSGKLLGVIATTALELGIDIGSLDAVITVGFPYTMAGLRQQAGRAGRRNKDSLAMLICDPYPLDQHYARNPHELFTSPAAELSLDLDNPMVLEGHLQCAAEEMPLHPKDDALYFGTEMQHICQERLVKDDEGFYHCHPRYRPHPSRHVSIRNTEDEHYTVVDITDGGHKVLEEIEWSRAVFEVYEGALFMHQGRTFIVKDVQHDARIARIFESNVDWMTKQRDFTDVDAVESLRIRGIAGSPCKAYYGRVTITSVVFGYFKVDRRNNILDTVDIDTPPFVRESHGLWLDVPQTALDILATKNIHAAASIHAAEHALLSLTPMFVMSVAGDIRTECKPPEKEFASRRSKRVRPARLTLYDTSGKSGGVCAKAFDHISRLIAQAVDTIANCTCLEGCPSCVASTVCSEGNIVTSKIGARIVLECLLGREIDLDSIPMQDPMKHVTPSDTIVAVAPVRTSTDVVLRQTPSP